MVGTNKILTVSYGTFSCTLEGFDDPFSTMRSIAEYFRDLAADDRYFGAEPPTPDAEMLHRIAEREVQRRVEAQVQTDGVLLRQVEEEDNAAAVEAFDSTAQIEAEETTEEAPAEELTAEAPAEEAPAPVEPTESVAEKLSRIRAVVARTRAAEELLVDHDGADQAEDAAPTAETMGDEASDTPAEEAADATEDEIAEAFAEFDAAEDSVAEDEVVLETAEDEALEEPVAVDESAEPIAEDEAAEDTAEEAPLMAEAADDTPVEDQEGEDHSDDAVAEAQDNSEGTWTPEPVFEEAEAEVSAEEDTAEADVVRLHAEDDTPAEEVEEPEMTEADPLSLETPWTEFEDETAESAAADLADDETEEEDSLAAGIRQAIGEADHQDEDEADQVWSEADDALEEAEREAQLEENLHAGQIAARDRLGVDRDETEQSGDVERLLEEADSQLADTEASRRRSAIAHLKAAVAATKADRLLKRVTAREKSESEEQAQYRDDLAQVVRPRRPAEAGEHQSERPAPLDQNKAPLMLISELRVDEETGVEMTDSVMPVRPRRVSADSDDVEGAGSFAEFAQEMGATDLPDLLEAAAAYAAFVENRPHFSRPQLMKRVAKYDRSADFSREDGLRSFGQLLRQGKIQKLKRGQFTVSETTRFNPDSRIAGE